MYLCGLGQDPAQRKISCEQKNQRNICRCIGELAEVAVCIIGGADFVTDGSPGLQEALEPCGEK